MTDDRLESLLGRIAASQDRVEAVVELLRSEVTQLGGRVSILENDSAKLEEPNRLAVRELQRDVQGIKAWLKLVTAAAGTGFVAAVKLLSSWWGH